MSEVYQSFGAWAAQVIRLYKNDLHFEIEWTVGPIDIRCATVARISNNVSI